VAKKLLFFFLVISCSSVSNESTLLQQSSDNPLETNQNRDVLSLNSEEILIEIFDAYKTFSENPDVAIDIIWNFAHEDNQEVTGPKERFSMMLTSEPYDSIVDLKDYSYEVIMESNENIQYEVKVLAKNNNYFVITWIFKKTICNDKPCWRTIGVSQPEYFDSGI
tara:strand:- start:638 stop:1132 length:495 start_codon:yes stop_codon:yes gene_type:complete